MARLFRALALRLACLAPWLGLRAPWLALACLPNLRPWLAWLAPLRRLAWLGLLAPCALAWLAPLRASCAVLLGLRHVLRLRLLAPWLAPALRLALNNHE